MPSFAPSGASKQFVDARSPGSLSASQGRSLCALIVIQYFHEGAKYGVVPLVTGFVLLLEFGRVLILIALEVRHVFEQVLHGVDLGIGMLMAQQSAHAVGKKHARRHDIGDVCLAHPALPVLALV